MSKTLSVLIFFLLPIAVQATHLRGGQIRVVSADGLKLTIELRLLTNTGSETLAGEGLFNFGDGSTITTETKANVIVKDQSNVGLVVYTFVHNYAGPGTFLLSYKEPNLAGGILNMTNSAETRFYIETYVVVDPLMGNVFISPNFPTNPIFTFPLGQEYSFSTAAIDDDKSNEFYYKYSLVTNPEEIKGYEIPGDLAVNPDNGIITWDTRFHGQYVAGLFWIEVKVKKYSKSGVYYGYVIRALQLVVEDSGSRIALSDTLSDPDNKLIVTDSQEKKIKFILSDNKGVDSLYFELYYNNTIKNNISIQYHDSTSDDKKFRIATLSLKTSSDIVTDLPYPVTLRGHSNYLKDITLLYLTKDVELPGVPGEVVTAVTEITLHHAYPNPFRSELYIDAGASAHVTFINGLGQVVMTSPVLQGQPVNTETLPAGSYILKIADPGGRTSMHKLVRN
jgi:hypothetical protein